MVDLAALKQAMGDLDESLVTELLDKFVAENPGEAQTRSVVTACQQGMEIVGNGYERGEYFVGDLIFAGELLTGCVERLGPLLGGGNARKCGTIVLGTVEGDIHDIGKNIFKIMAEAAGFEVVDVGIDTPPAVFVSAVREHKPEIVGLSGILTLSIESMKKTIEALKAENLRDSVKITIGGNAVSADACHYTGADAWSKNAAETVAVCGEWVGWQLPSPPE